MKKFLLVLATLVILCTTMFNTKNIEAWEVFDILSHSVDVVVNEDGRFEITETMSVHFNTERHGIYVNIPQEYFMDWDYEDIQTYREYYFPVTDVKVLSDHNYKTENQFENYRITIGSENYYAKEYETYKWSYTIHTKDLELNGRQMVFLNIITRGWNTPTLKASFTIQMPKEFDATKIAINNPEGGMYYGQFSEDGVSVKVVGNTIYGEYNKTIGRNDALTIQVGLPDDYFSFPNYSWVSNAAIIFGCLAGLAVFVLWYFFGKDDPLVRQVEYHVPVNLNSAEVGKIIDTVTDDSDIISMILDFARRGILTINEKKDGLYLHKIRDIEPEAREYEKYFVSALFEEGNTVSVESLKYKFYKTIDKVRNKIDGEFKTGARVLVDPLSIKLQIISTILSGIPAMVYVIAVRAAYYGGVEATGLGVGIFNLIMIPFCIAIANVADKKRFVTKIYGQIGTYFTVGFVACFVAAGILAATYMCASIPATIAIVVIELIIGILTVSMPKRTKYGNDMLSRVLGLRSFIRHCQHEDAQKLLDENPYYYYDLLPFAYALGLTSVWNDAFEDLTVRNCEWYTSYRDFDNHHHRMSHMCKQIRHTGYCMTSTSDSSSSGGSGSSGGSSSSGFSGGGGFGGSSGGSW